MFPAGKRLTNSSQPQVLHNSRWGMLGQRQGPLFLPQFAVRASHSQGSPYSSNASQRQAMHPGHSPTLGNPSGHQNPDSQLRIRREGTFLARLRRGAVCRPQLFASDGLRRQVNIPESSQVPMEGLSSPHWRTLSKLRHLLLLIQMWCEGTSDHITLTINEASCPVVLRRYEENTFYSCYIS